jgi:DNA-binding PadR family transcriptional regulator
MRGSNNRRAVYYSITRSGKRQLAREEARWHEAATAVNRVLRLADQEG